MVSSTIVESGERLTRPAHKHTLIIGGTGMLKHASIALASASQMLTSVARTLQSLQCLDAALGSSAGVHHMLKLDWSEPEVFLSSLSSHIERVCRPSLVVAWVHDEGLMGAITACFDSASHPCKIFQVRSCAAADPTREPSSGQFADSSIGRMVRNEIILGFEVGNDGSRWLTNTEISSGVLQAIANNEKTAVVGVVSPWESRPQSNGDGNID